MPNTETFPSAHSQIPLLQQINNNLVLLFALMSNGAFVGVQLPGGNGEIPILRAINNNLFAFFTWWVANPPAGFSLKAGIVDLSLNDVSKAVVFSSAFGAKPSVIAIVAAPDNTGFVISLGPDNSNVSATGFTALFGAAIPAAGYKLYWIATPTTQ